MCLFNAHITLFFDQYRSIRAALNLEGDLARIYSILSSPLNEFPYAAAGTTGRELLFQATSEEMIEAYSHVPR